VSAEEDLPDDSRSGGDDVPGKIGAFAMYLVEVAGDGGPLGVGVQDCPTAGQFDEDPLPPP